MASKLLDDRGKRKVIGCGKRFHKDGKPELMERQSVEELLSRPISSLDLGRDQHAKRAIKALSEAGIETIGDLASASGLDGLAGLKGIGKKTIERLKAALAGLGLPQRGSPCIILKENGQLETTLSYEQSRTLIRLARLELQELGEIVQPEKLKCLVELLGLISIPGDDLGALSDDEFSARLAAIMKSRGIKGDRELAEREPELYKELERRRAEHGVYS